MEVSTVIAALVTLEMELIARTSTNVKKTCIIVIRMLLATTTTEVLTAFATQDILETASLAVIETNVMTGLTTAT